MVKKPTPPDTTSAFSRLTNDISERYQHFKNAYIDELSKTKGGQDTLRIAKSAGKFIEDSSSDIKNTFDNIAGAETYRQIMALTEVQKRYNDVLATRLAEALNRIEALENRLAEIEKP